MKLSEKASLLEPRLTYEECLKHTIAPGAETTANLAEDGGRHMQWTTPSYTDIRLGFEITMYIATR